MQYLQFVFKFLMGLFSLMAFTLICRGIANYIGEQLGVAEFLKRIWQRLRRK